MCFNYNPSFKIGLYKTVLHIFFKFLHYIVYCKIVKITCLAVLMTNTVMFFLSISSWITVINDRGKYGQDYVCVHSQW